MTELSQYPICESEPLVLHDAPESQFDLIERTTKFSEELIRFVRAVPNDVVTTPLISQLVRAGTSIGANYSEADEAISRKEFRQKIGFCRKEAKETKYWLRVLVTAHPPSAEEARRLWREARELHLIFCSIVRKLERKESFQA